MSKIPHILSVEDDIDATVLLEHAKKRAGVNCTMSSVTDGPGAIAYLRGVGRFQDRGLNPCPDLVLLDLKLPKFSGLEVLKWIRSQEDLKVLPVVVLSSSSNPTDVDEAYKAGANSYLTKPVSLDAFTKLFANFHSYWFKDNVLPVSDSRDRPNL